MRDVFKSGFVLLVITVLAGLGLGWVNEITKDKIASQALGAVAESLSIVLPDADSFAEIDSVDGYDNISAVYEGQAADGLAGYIISISEQGYAGVVESLVAIDPNGVITGVDVVNHTETPGLGSKAAEPEFLSQYIGRSKSQKVVKAAPGDDEIQAVASATITSNTVNLSVNNALDYYYDNLGDPSARPEDDSSDASAGDLKSLALPNVESFEQLDLAGEHEGISAVYKGVSSGQDVGYVMEAGYEGYGGIVTCLVGIDSSGVVTGVEIAEHSETPGLGSAIEEADFRNQYIGISSSQYVVTEAPGNDEILAVAHATVSSIAVTVNVNNSLKYFNEALNGEAVETASIDEELEIEAVEISEDDLKVVLSGADSFEAMDVISGHENVSAVYKAMADGETLGYVFGLGAEGFSGTVETLVALDTEGVTTGVHVVSQTETDGLGSKIQDQDFLDKFVGKSNKQYVVTEAPGTDEIQAISGATISTVAVAVCVNDAIGYFNDNIGAQTDADVDTTADEISEEEELENEEASEDENLENENLENEEILEEGDSENEEAPEDELEAGDSDSEDSAVALEDALSGLLADADSFEQIEILDGYDNVSAIYEGFASGETVGYVFALESEGFSGMVETLVAMDLDGVISGVEVVNQTETDGLGSKIEEPEFLEKFIGKSNKQYVVTEDPGTDEVQAIAGATISTVAVAVCVNDALGYFADNLNADAAEEEDEAARVSVEIEEDILSELLQDADEFEPLDIGSGYENITAVYKGIASDETVGYVICNGAEGYGGMVESLIALDFDGVVSEVKIHNHSETDGIGSLVEEAEFLDQFTGITKSQYVVTETPGNDEILAVAHATISSIAVTLSVNNSLDYFDNNLREAE